MKRQYKVNCELLLDRVDSRVYKRVRTAASKWEPVAVADYQEDGFCGNFASDLIWDEKKQKVVFKKKIDHLNFNYTGIYEVIPSALLLYRLLCLFKCEVRSEGPDGYKLVWSIVVRHKESGTQFMFYEWKGGVTMGFSFTDGKEPSAKVKRDILELINVLCSKDCPHPYDGTVAGSVA